MVYAHELVHLEIENMQRCITLIPICIEIMKKFDGKVVNKRLETALREATGETIILQKNDLTPIIFYTNKRYVRGDEGLTEYISNPTYSLIGVCRDFMTDGRLNATAAIDAMKYAMEYYVYTIEEYVRSDAQIDELKAKIRSLEETIEEIKRSIPFTVMKYHGIF